MVAAETDLRHRRRNYVNDGEDYSKVSNELLFQMLEDGIKKGCVILNQARAYNLQSLLDEVERRLC